MDSRLLEVFRTVAQHGSITTAARQLRFTQSAVSRQIAALEAEVGARLFDRMARGVTLTEEGRTLVPHAEAVLDRLDGARRDLAALRGLRRGRLRVGAFPTAVAALVPRALAGFRDAHPAVELSLVEGRTPVLLERLAAGDADAAVVSASPGSPLDDPAFDLHHLLDERLLVAVSREHRLARRRTVRLVELATDPFVVGSATAEETLLRASLPHGFSPGSSSSPPTGSESSAWSPAGWASRWCRPSRCAAHPPTSPCCACTRTTSRSGASSPPPPPAAPRHPR